MKDNLFIAAKEHIVGDEDNDLDSPTDFDEYEMNPDDCAPDEYDGQPDEAQEWSDFDPDC